MVRSNVAQDRPYTGLTEIRSGEVAEDLASYLVDSEQVRLDCFPLRTALHESDDMGIARA